MVPIITDYILLISCYELAPSIGCLTYLGSLLTLSLREANHSGSGVITMGRETVVSDSPIYPEQF